MPVSVTAISAAGTTLPDGSVMVPERPALVVWPTAKKARRTDIRNARGSGLAALAATATKAIESGNFSFDKFHLALTRA